ncbi:GNAT family N-acetyltransferase [Clostridium chrysemydis]|uniref:GNAT family N-acetyltransferase n=1 Tax=Clostridium chrysemydis TaxID=2665504 RepID=UPI003F31E460
MVVEKLKKEDIKELLELYKELIDTKNDISISKETYEKILKDDNYYLAVLKKDNIILGSALAVSCFNLSMGGCTFIVVEDVIVKENTRGLGIGKKLMKAIDDFAKSKNAAYSILVSSSHRKDAHKFYENIGYTDSVLGFRKIYKEI